MSVDLRPEALRIGALCGIWANSKFFLLARSRRADRVGSAGHTADCFDRNVRPDSDLI
jgi:hypothetical protein